LYKITFPFIFSLFACVVNFSNFLNLPFWHQKLVFYIHDIILFEYIFQRIIKTFVTESFFLCVWKSNNWILKLFNKFCRCLLGLNEFINYSQCQKNGFTLYPQLSIVCVYLIFIFWNITFWSYFDAFKIFSALQTCYR